MVSRIHPLTGEPKGKRVNGRPRPDVIAALEASGQQRRAALSIDAVRSGDLDSHWQYANGLSADLTYSRQTRHKLMQRSRMECESNGTYAGICENHANMLVGLGPKLRMLTKNREFNQLVEREFAEWAKAIGLRRKLWTMAHARTADGEAFGILQTNPGIANKSQLDLLLIEAEQVQTPFLSTEERYVDGISFDEHNNIRWYDILPEHPGGNSFYSLSKAIPVDPRQVVHWYKVKRAGAHRGIPSMTSTLNLGATGRRFRDAVIAAAENAADMSAVFKTQSINGIETPEEVAPFTSIDVVKRMAMFLPEGWDVFQMRGEHPNAQYTDLMRSIVSETSRPICMPYNAAAFDSSTHSFASGKLDMLGYRASLDIERADCDEMTLDRIFAEWFAEWTIVASRRDIPPAHQWDWPAHAIIDSVAEASATNTKLLNGTATLSKVYSDNGEDYEDALTQMAEDWFGEANHENIAKARQINALRNIPPHAIQVIAQVMGVGQSSPTTTPPTGEPADEPELETAA